MNKEKNLGWQIKNVTKSNFCGAGGGGVLKKNFVKNGLLWSINMLQTNG